MAVRQPVDYSVELSQLLVDCGEVEGGTLISGIQLDSRQIQVGDLFVALAGDAQDGRHFIGDAIARGAVAVVAEPVVVEPEEQPAVPLVSVPQLRDKLGSIASNFFHHPSRQLHMVAVTGTNGKTTTSQLVAQLGRLAGKSCGVIGTLGASLGAVVSEAANTTPDAVALQRQLAQWRDADVFAVSVEVSSHALVQGRVNAVEFETAVFTNLSRDHLDYHGSMENYGRAKSQLFSMPGLRHAVVNADDAYAPQLLAGIDPAVSTWTYSVSANSAADIRVEAAQFSANGVRARYLSPWGEGDFHSPLAGDFNLANLAAALSAMVLAGVALEDLLPLVAQLQPVPGRMQRIPNDCEVQVIVDYAHTPDALSQALQALRPQVEGRLTVVFGCGGDRDTGKRPVMARLACEYADRVVVTSDNPRSEDPAAILADIELGCSGDYQLIEDRAKAIAAALDEAQIGDCVLIAGKGHEDYQIVAGQRRHFSDEEQALKVLTARAAS